MQELTTDEIYSCLRCTHKKTREKDDWHILSDEEWAVLLRLCSEHKRLNNHMVTKTRLVPSPLLPYGLETQTAEHILQRCWPATTCWGRPIGYWRPHHPQQELKRTALFTLRTGLSLWSVNGKEKMCSFIITIRNSRVPIGVNWFVQW